MEPAAVSGNIAAPVGETKQLSSAVYLAKPSKKVTVQQELLRDSWPQQPAISLGQRGVICLTYGLARDPGILSADS